MPLGSGRVLHVVVLLLIGGVVTALWRLAGGGLGTCCRCIFFRAAAFLGGLLVPTAGGSLLRASGGGLLITAACLLDPGHPFGPRDPGAAAAGPGSGGHNRKVVDASPLLIVAILVLTTTILITNNRPVSRYITFITAVPWELTRTVVGCEIQEGVVAGNDRLDARSHLDGDLVQDLRPWETLLRFCKTEMSQSAFHGRVAVRDPQRVLLVADDECWSEPSLGPVPLALRGPPPTEDLVPDGEEMAHGDGRGDRVSRQKGMAQPSLVEEREGSPARRRQQADAVRQRPVLHDARLEAELRMSSGGQGGASERPRQHPSARRVATRGDSRVQRPIHGRDGPREARRVVEVDVALVGEGAHHGLPGSSATLSHPVLLGLGPALALKLPAAINQEGLRESCPR